MVSVPAARSLRASPLCVLRALAITALALALAACTSSSDDAGAAPTLRDFSLTTTTLTVGKAAVLDGLITVDDSDGDIAGLSSEIALPSGTTQTLPQANVAAGSAETVPIQLKGQPSLPVAGKYTLRVSARGNAGNESSMLEQALAAR